MQPYQPSDALLASQKLEHFVRFFSDVMDELSGVNGPGVNIPKAAFRPSWSPALRAQFREAWNDAKEDVDAVISELGRVGLDLRSHGLEGVQLDFKLDAIASASSRLAEAESIGLWGPIKKWLRKLLQLIDILLKSVLAAVGVGGSLEELKSVAEVHIDDDDDDGEAVPA